MDANQQIRDIIKSAVDEDYGGSVNRLAELSGIAQSSLDRFIKGTYKGLNSQTLAKIFDVIGVKLSRERVAGQDYIFVVRSAARPAAGGSSLETDGRIEDVLAFRRDWIVRKTVSSPEKLTIMTAIGDSMEPTINSGDVILIDQGEAGKTLREGQIFVVRAEGEIFVKRYFKGIGFLMFRGDNPDMAFNDLRISADSLDGFAVIGRVIWSGRDF